MTGVIVRVHTDRGFGFIRPTEHSMRDVFFHFKDLQGLTFGPELVGRRVAFGVTDTSRGLRASLVRGDEAT